MTQELAVIPAEQQAAWLTLAAAKNALTKDLQGREMTLQSLLLNKPTTALAEALAEYRKQHADMVETRKRFTGVIQAKLIEPLMEPEKRMAPDKNAAYITAAALELEHRKKIQKALEDQQALASEMANFKVFFQNEYLNISAAYRAELAGIISRAYMDALAVKTPDPHKAISAATLAMEATKPKDPGKFTRVLLTPEKATEIYTQLHKPDFATMLSDAKQALKEKFELYQHDLASAESAIESEKQAVAVQFNEIKNDTAAQAAANTLIGASEAFLLPEPGFKGVTERNRIIIRDESQDWVARIVAAFLANINKCFPLLRVKKYSQLNIKQMAESLDTAGINVDGVDYETVEK